MLTDTLISIFNRDLTKLKTEIALYENEANIWLIEKKLPTLPAIYAST